MTSVRKLAAALPILAPALAAAQSASAGDQQSDPGRLWWTWVVVAVILVAALTLIFFTHGPRRRAFRDEQARRELHGRDPTTVER